MLLRSAVDNRADYLRRPDWGRRLNETSRQQLTAVESSGPFDLCIIISDGLSSRAIEHVLSVVVPLQKLLIAEAWKIAPVLVVSFGHRLLEHLAVHEFQRWLLVRHGREVFLFGNADPNRCSHVLTIPRRRRTP